MEFASGPNTRQPTAAVLLMTGSGFASLGYQIVWAQQSSVWLGTESAAVLAIVAAFFAGLAIGALLLGGSIARSAHPQRWYAGSEAVIAIWAGLLTLVMAPVGERMLGVIGVAPSAGWQWSVAFVGTFLLLLPATAAMGATLPAMERLVAGWRSDGRSVAWLYASNTAGAVAGVLATAFWLLPSFGMKRVALLCCVINLACAIGALLLLPLKAHATPVPRLAAPGAARGVLARLAITGLLGIGYEVLTLRMLGQVTEGTVYTVALLLAVYFLGTSAGAAGYGRWFARRRSHEQVTAGLLLALAAACLLGATSLWGAASLKSFALHVLGVGLGPAFAAEALLAVAAFAAPTLIMGALFSHLGNAALEAGVSFGCALAVNMLGAAVAPLLFGVLVLPWLGAKAGMVVVCCGYLALLPPLAWRSRYVHVVAAIATAIAIVAPPLRILDVPPGARVLQYADGALGSVSVVEDAAGVIRLRIDNHQQEGSNTSLRVDARQGLLPLLLQPAPRRALFLGLGTGVTAASAAAYGGVEVDVAELVPEVIEASALFTPGVAPGGPPPNLHIIAADARRFVRVTPASYDVVVSDNFHPARAGSAGLYTVQHFAAVRTRLTADGLFCQWLPLHQLDLQTLRSIVQSFLEVFPHGTALLASNSLETPVLGLLGRADDGGFDFAALRTRLQRESSARYAALGMEDEFALLGSFVAGASGLRQFAADAPANTDDLPLVAYSAPRILYAPDSAPGDRLITFLHQVSMQPTEILSGETDSDFVSRLQAYWRARDRFVELGRNVIPSADPRQMLARVSGPLLSILRISPDFRPAYDPLLRMAAALAVSDAADSRDVLGDLIAAQPARSDARLALAQLDATPH